MSANNTSPDHYKNKAIQPWDYIVSNNLGFLEGNIIKYITRWRGKGGVDDLRKAKHHIEKLIEMETGTAAPETDADAVLRAQRATWDARTKGAK